MPPQPHEPPCHDPALNAAHSGATTIPAAYRACVPNIDPGTVLRNVRRCNGFRSWSLAPREIYQLADCTLTVYEHHDRAPRLVLDGPDAEQIRSLLARLGFEPHDVVINELQPTEDSP